MNFLDKVKEMQNNAIAGVKKFSNKKFLDAVVCGCAMVAAADGNISAEEKQKMIGFIQRNEALKVFDTNTVVERFNHFAGNFDFDAMIGKRECLTTIGKIKGNTEEAKMCVTVCCAIGASDGEFDPKEKAMVKDICKELGLNPSEFSL